MKTKFLITTGLVLYCVNLHSQDIINVLKNFYGKADIDCYIEKVQKRMHEEHNLLGQWDSLHRLYIPPPDINLSQSILTPILNIQFVNTENYSYSDNIYDYITIDSVWAFSFVYIDKNKKVYASINFAEPYRTYNIGNKQSEEIKLIKKISGYNPELILRCAIIAGGFGNMYDDGYMYIKGDKIYKYIMYNGKSCELNEYFQNYPRIEDTRKYLNHSYIPLIFQKETDERRTGNAPENEKMICPTIN
jgi:hypothetical protein